MILLILLLLIAVGLVFYYHQVIFNPFGVFVTVDVSGRRNVNESEVLDEWLIEHFNDYRDLQSYFYKYFDKWDEYAKLVLDNVFLFKKNTVKNNIIHCVNDI